MTRYWGAHDAEGRAWITWDGEQVASFETVPLQWRYNDLVAEFKQLGQDPDEASERATAIVAQDGMFASYELQWAVERYPDLGIDEAVASDDPLTRGLAMLDRRLGKRRLAAVELRTTEQPFVRRLLELRREADARRG